jgi:hypothetical protein
MYPLSVFEHGIAIIKLAKLKHLLEEKVCDLSLLALVRTFKHFTMVGTY